MFMPLSQVQFHEAIAPRCEIDCLRVPCHLALSRPVLVFCVVGYVRYTTNAHTMGICCVLLEPPINVAYLLYCIAIKNIFCQLEVLQEEAHLVRDTLVSQ